MPKGKERKPKVSLDASVAGPGICDLCHWRVKDSKDKINNGELLETSYTSGQSKHTVRAHYFCLLFACGLAQNGREEEGMKGFLGPDIRKEASRGGKLTCKLCNKKGATVGCIVEKCKMSYHFPCGVQAGFQFNFSKDPFESRCKEHYEQKQRPNEKIKKGKYDCLMCHENLNFPSNSAIYCPKCFQVSDRVCIQQQAYSAGKSHFQCAKCRNKTWYRLIVQRNGVYLPEKDADWELEGMFDDQVVVNHKCKAANCLCKEGREHHVEHSEWDIAVCTTCGGDSKHAKCAAITVEAVKTWLCGNCGPILNKAHNGNENAERKGEIGSDEVSSSEDDHDSALPVQSSGTNEKCARVLAEQAAKKLEEPTDSINSNSIDCIDTSLGKGVVAMNIEQPSSSGLQMSAIRESNAFRSKSPESSSDREVSCDKEVRKKKKKNYSGSITPNKRLRTLRTRSARRELILSPTRKTRRTKEPNGEKNPVCLGEDSDDAEKEGNDGDKPICLSGDSDIEMIEDLVEVKDDGPQCIATVHLERNEDLIVID